MTGTRKGTLVVAAAIGLVLSTAVAEAATPDRKGWWSSTSSELPVRSAGPDVPEGGLLVQGDADSPGAYSALAFELGDGEAATELTLSAVAGTVPAPQAVVQVCPLVDGAFEEADGGPIDDGPAYDCSAGVESAMDPEDRTFRWDVGALASDGGLAVALVGTGPLTRVAFDPPSFDALGTNGASPAGPAPTGAGVSPGAETSDPSRGPAPPSRPGGRPRTPELPVGGSSQPAAPPTVPVPQVLQPSASSGVGDELAAPLGFVPTPGGEADVAQVLLFALVLAAVGVCWVAAGNEKPVGQQVGAAQEAVP